MYMDKVFVLAIEWTIDYESDHNVSVFATRELAHDFMIKDYENFCHNCFDNWTEHGDDRDAAWCFMEGDYSANHCTWTIHEEEIITGKEGE